MVSKMFIELQQAQQYFHPKITETLAIIGGGTGLIFFGWWIKSLFAKKAAVTTPASKTTAK